MCKSWVCEIFQREFSICLLFGVCVCARIHQTSPPTTIHAKIMMYTSTETRYAPHYILHTCRSIFFNAGIYYAGQTGHVQWLAIMQLLSQGSIIMKPLQGTHSVIIHTSTSYYCSVTHFLNLMQRRCCKYWWSTKERIYNTYSTKNSKVC